MTRFALLAACLCAGACAEPEPATPFTNALFAAAREWGERFDEAEARAQLAAIAIDVGHAASSGSSRVAALNDVVFERRQFVREVDDHDLRFTLLPSVLASGRGSCVGLGTLYLALGERLGWDMRGVIMPGHFFVRLRDAHGHTNIELLRRGEQMPDTWYPKRFPIPGGSAREYARPLTPEEVIGVVEYNAGEDRRARSQLLEARRAYDRAGKHFPDLAEAHASRGAVAHLLGELDVAWSDYQTARRSNPNLPGVDQNLALLEHERRGEAPALTPATETPAD